MKFKINILSFFIIFLLVFSSSIVVSAEENNTQSSEVTPGETIVSYAMKWNQNPNIPYVYGGPGRGKTLETCDKEKLGTDCSGFVTSVFMHFGIAKEGEGWMSEDYLGAMCEKKTTKMEEAEPGYVCHWEGHVALYIGDGKIIHTNTAKPDKDHPKMPTNYIHVTELKDYKKYLSGTTTFIKIKGSDAYLGQGSSSVSSAESCGSVLTDSDLTGMPIESTLLGSQEMVELYGADDLSLVAGNSLQTIKENMNLNKVRVSRYLHIITMFLGICCTVYAVLILVASVFDSINRWVDISLLGVLSLNKWAIIHKGDTEYGDVHIGYNKSSNKTLLTFKMLLFRMAIIFIVGIVLISGVITNLVAEILTLLNR